MGKQGRDGRFVGKEDFAPELALERFWNEKNVAFALHVSNSATPQMTPFDTGMSVEETGDADEAMDLGRKWVLRGGVVQPLGPVTVPGSNQWGSAEGLFVQLQYPGHGQMLGREERGVLGRASMTMMNMGTLVGRNTVVWPLPLDILMHKAIFAEELEIWARTGAAQADFDEAYFCMTLCYGWAPASNRDLIIARQQSG